MGWVREGMEAEQVMKRAIELRVEGRRRRGRPQLRWEDCVNRDLTEVGGIRGNGDRWWRRL